MIDIHSHVLPEIDDGSKSWDETMEMVTQAAEDGIAEFAITHHILSNLAYDREEEIQVKYEELKKRIAQRKLNIKPYLGAEIYAQPDMELFHTISTYNDNKRYFLVEFPMQGIPRFVGERFFDLILEGMTPIIAHPERNLTVIGNPERAFEFVQRGALLQMNASSLTGRHGPRVRDTARTLLGSNLIHFVGSDAHNVRSRPMKLSKAREIVSEEWGEERATLLFESNPRKAIAGELIEPPEPTPVKKQTDDRFYKPAALLRRFFGTS